MPLIVYGYECPVSLEMHIVSQHHSYTGERKIVLIISL